MNWGGFAGGFAQGFNNGVSMGKTINDMRKQQGIDDVRKAAVEEAAAARGDAVGGMVKDNQAPVAPTAPTAPSVSTASDTGKAGQPAPATAGVTTSPVVQPVAEVTTPVTATPAASAATTPNATPAATTPGMPPDAAQSTPATSATPATPTAMVPALAPMPAETPATALAGQVAPAPAAAPAAAGITPKRFSVGDQSFDTREEAMKFAEKAAPTKAEFTGKAVAKKLEQHFIETGDIESAEKWGTWAKAKDNERKMETWADAFKAAQTGDYMGSARKLMKLYPDFNDGHTLVSATPVKDASGKETGFKMTTRDKAGKETTIEHDAQTISRVGLAQMNPQKMFEMDRAEQVAASTARAKAAADAANDTRTLKKELIVEGVKANTAATAATVKHGREKELNATKNDQDVEKLTIKQQLDDASLAQNEKRKVETKIDFLTRSGKSQSEINLMMPALVGAGDYKKVTDPVERRALIANDLAKDPMFELNNKTPDAKRAAINGWMDAIYGPGGAGVSPSNIKPAPAPTAATSTDAKTIAAAKAAVGGISAPPAALPASGVTYYRKPDGSVGVR